MSCTGIYKYRNFLSVHSCYKVTQRYYFDYPSSLASIDPLTHLLLIVLRYWIITSNMLGLQLTKSRNDKDSPEVRNFSITPKSSFFIFGFLMLLFF
ncbi:hypothetical protein AYI69_g9023 [Smittium culicis]|uniref:Uncharacterized protein n=1 Tax=Smittium culicis TaxID=133412 RepID=A0A1R1XFI6_9FUNG|nr:hypothetical protein AYI69_g9023 [Smittium culicis]